MLLPRFIDPSQKDLKTIKHTYSYDAYGNLLSEYKRGNGQGQAKEDWAYQYDELNRLVQAHEDHGNQTRNYQYDSLGSRYPFIGHQYAQSVKVIDTLFSGVIGSNYHPVAFIKHIGAHHYRYVYGVDKLGVTAYTIANGSASVTTDAGEIPLYYHMDHMGSSEFLTSDVTHIHQRIIEHIGILYQTLWVAHIPLHRVNCCKPRRVEDIT